MKKTITKIFLFAAVFGCLSLTGCGEKKVDLSKYVTATFSGVNGKGEATVSLDYEALSSLLYSDSSLSELVSSALNSTELISSLAVTPNQSQYLKNGDEIKIACKYDNDIAKEFGIRFTYKEQTVTVSGLTEAEAISAQDILDSVEIVYEGVSPDVTAYVNTENCPYSSFVWFSLDKTSGIQEGDELHLTIEVDDYTAEEYGYVVIGDDLEETITVGELAAYATIYDEIGEEALTAIKNQASDVLEAWKAQNSGWRTYSGGTPMRTIFMASKTDDNWTMNKIIFIYQMDMTYSDETSAYYIGIGLENIIKNADGTNTYELSDIYVMDYDETYAELYSSLVTSKVDAYTVSEYEY